MGDQVMGRRKRSGVRNFSMRFPACLLAIAWFSFRNTQLFNNIGVAWVGVGCYSQEVASERGAGKGSKEPVLQFERYADFSSCLRFVCTMLQRRESSAKVGEYQRNTASRLIDWLVGIC
jgi:hypothetical protein